jgi:hypothetical protein
VASLLLDPVADVALAAKEALAAIDPRVAKEATTVLVDADAKQRIAAMNEVAKLSKEGRSISPIMYAVIRAPEGDPLRRLKPTAAVILDMKLAAVQALVAVSPDDDKLPDLLAKLATDKEGRVRLTAVQSFARLEKIGNRKNAAALLSALALGDPSAPVRTAAADSLGVVGRDLAGVEEVLRKASADPESTVRDAAERALVALRKKP